MSMSESASSSLSSSLSSSSSISPSSSSSSSPSLSTASSSEGEGESPLHPLMASQEPRTSNSAPSDSLSSPSSSSRGESSVIVTADFPRRRRKENHQSQRRHAVGSSVSESGKGRGSARSATPSGRECLSSSSHRQESTQALLLRVCSFIGLARPIAWRDVRSFSAGDSSYWQRQFTPQIRWQITVVVAALVAATLGPLRLAFSVTDGDCDRVSCWPLGGFGVAIDVATDLVLWVDTGAIVLARISAHKRPARAFRSIWFLVLLVSVLPVDYLVWFSGAWHFGLRLNRLFRLLQAHEISSEWRLHTGRPALLLLSELVVGVALLAHWCGCAFLAISAAYGYGESVDTDWLLAEAYSDIPAIDQYLAVLVWGIQLVAGIPIETNNPLTHGERGFAMLLALFKLLVVALLVGEIIALISGRNEFAERYRMKLTNANEFMRVHDVPEKLRNQVRTYYRLLSSVYGGLSYAEVLECVPRRLRGDLALETHGSLVSKCGLFQQCNRAFLRELVTALRHEIFVPSQTIVKEGEVGQEMFFVNRGIVIVAIGSGISLAEGSFFGEIALISENLRRTATVKADTYVDTLVLRKSSLEEVVSRYPDEAKIIWAAGARRLVETRLREDFRQSLFADLIHHSFATLKGELDEDRDISSPEETSRVSSRLFRSQDGAFLSKLVSIFETDVVQAEETITVGINSVVFLADGTVDLVVTNAGVSMDSLCVSVVGGLRSEFPERGRIGKVTRSPIMLGLSDVLLRRESSALEVTTKSRCAIARMNLGALDDLLGFYSIASVGKASGLDFKACWDTLGVHARAKRGISRRKAVLIQTASAREEADQILSDLRYLQSHPEDIAKLSANRQVQAAEVLSHLADDALRTVSFRQHSSTADKGKATPPPGVRRRRHITTNRWG